MSIYVELTRLFNKGKLRSIISSGQAVVLHRLAFMSKDGDWILKEDSETMHHILEVLESRGAYYRYGAPLDIRWLSWGWSAHFEFVQDQIRVRTDFVTSPPRISKEQLKKIWKEQKDRDIPFIGSRYLAEIKKTNREKDYPIIGELARLMLDPAEQLEYSRSARDLIALAKQYPELIESLCKQRLVLKEIKRGRGKLEEALDAERRTMIHENEKRLVVYASAAEKWYKKWNDIKNKIKNISLIKSHGIIVKYAENLLPFRPKGIEKWLS